MNPATLSGGRPDKSMTPALRTARLLGWASFGLAAAFLVAPKRIARTFGLEGKETLIRAFGAQEVMAGVGALSVDATPAMWSRAGGDLIHIGTLATGLRNGDDDQRRNALIGLGALAGFLLVDSLVASKLGAERSRERGETRDYSDRSGFPQGAAKARGAARDFETPKDFKAAPELAEAL
jgi:hypothetical protein